MFCFQCEQTAMGTGCTNAGVCGKMADTADLQDELTGKLIALARAVRGNIPSANTTKLIIDGLFTTMTNVNFNNESLRQLIEDVKAKKAKLGASVGYDMSLLWDNDKLDIRSLRSLLLFGLRGMAAYAHHAYVLGYSDDDVNIFICEALCAVGDDEMGDDELLALVMELGRINLKCMELLDTANTSTYGKPTPTKVSCNIEPGPFIVISGHDLGDLHLLLEQTKGVDVNIYTHGEMLPAHAYPELKRYSNLKGHFGTAWQNQQKEFDNIPAPILFTTNCIMPVKKSYADRVFTTSVVSYPNVAHIEDTKDFTAIINKALELKGYWEGRKMTGINGGDTLMTGFAKDAMLSVADKIVEAVRTGEIKHFFLVGGCDGAQPGRNYYTEFVKQTPKDSIILTLACGKYRFNDLDLGEIAGLPRIIDMGQCNDAFSAIKVAMALAEAFDCSINELPLTLVLSWYEQKAVCILITLLALGIQNIYVGPSLPAFISPNILKTLEKQFNLTQISTPEGDLRKIL